MNTRDVTAKSGWIRRAIVSAATAVAALSLVGAVAGEPNEVKSEDAATVKVVVSDSSPSDGGFTTLRAGVRW